MRRTENVHIATERRTLHAVDGARVRRDEGKLHTLIDALADADLRALAPHTHRRASRAVLAQRLDGEQCRCAVGQEGVDFGHDRDSAIHEVGMLADLQ